MNDARTKEEESREESRSFSFVEGLLVFSCLFPSVGNIS